jgi:inorganic phosphate transporter, PiT family
MTLILIVILAALIFEFINGLHDTANSIAAVVSTKALSPRMAIVLAATTNLFGALAGTAVAKTIASGLVDGTVVTSQVLICALFGAIIWNVLTWWLGLPSSSSHALIGGLCGAALAAAHDNWSVIVWSQPAADHWWHGKGLLWKVVVPMVISPVCGFFLAFAFMAILYLALHKARPTPINRIFSKLQLLSAGSIGFMHGTNDAQKTMGIIALALVAGTNAGAFEGLPDWLGFLRLHTHETRGLDIPAWVKVVCALTMAAGTAVGGWRIIRTLGKKMVRLQPINGFASDTASAAIIAVASHYGIPVSTTHNVSAAIMGVGAARRFDAIKWHVVERMVWAWILTVPIAGGIAYGLVRAALAVGWMP